MKAIIYTKEHCHYCVKAKRLFELNNIEYEEISAVDQREKLFERVTSITGEPPKSVPQIFIDGEYIGGHAELVKFLEN